MIESERVLIEIIIQVFVTYSPLIGVQQPSIQRRSDPLAARQQILPHVGALARELVHVILPVKADVSLPPIGPDYAAGFDRLGDHRLEALGRSIPYSTKPNPANSIATGLYCNENQRPFSICGFAVR